MIAVLSSVLSAISEDVVSSDRLSSSFSDLDMFKLSQVLDKVQVIASSWSVVDEHMTRRNEPCPCGKSARFKHCHGHPSNVAAEEALRILTSELQRPRPSDGPRPIISTVVAGLRWVSVNGQLFSGSWLTFNEFLIHYLRARLGPTWINSEEVKAPDQRHPLIDWLRVLGEQIRDLRGPAGQIAFMPSFGAVRAVVGLAYDLFLIEHHICDEKSAASFTRLMTRLRRQEQFFGARHEARVAAIFLRAGFDLAWEDENERKSGGHGEFIACFPITGRSFWVECKMRQPVKNKDRCYADLLAKALRKSTYLERMVFIEMNMPSEENNAHNDDNGGWHRDVIKQLRNLEIQPNSKNLPPAFVWICNFPEHWHLETVPKGCGIMLEGFKTDDHRLEVADLVEHLRQHEDNPEIEALWSSIHQHISPPLSFESSDLPIRRLYPVLVGRSYVLEDGTIGILEEAVVIESWHQITCFFRKASGVHETVSKFLDDCIFPEHACPEPEPRATRPPISTTTSVDLFSAVCRIYASTPQDRLIEMMSDIEGIEIFKEFSHYQTLLWYACMVVKKAVDLVYSRQVPKWLDRLPRPWKPKDHQEDFTFDH